MIALPGVPSAEPPTKKRASERFVFRFMTLLLAFAAPLAVPEASADPESHLERFKIGNEHFARGDVKAALGEYEPMVRRGPVSANLFLNLGNAHFQTGNLGLAAVFYERALHLDPGHMEADRNLRTTLEKAGTSPRKVSWFESFARRMALLKTQGLWPVLGSLSFWLLAAGVSGLCLFQSKSVAGFAIGIGLFGVLTSAAMVHVQSTESRRALIIAPQTVALSAPADRAQVVLTLTAGVPVQLLSERGPWTYCKLPGKSKGWIASPHLQAVYPRP
jgi:tetratricopeptide (TPR) repeat protein